MPSPTFTLIGRQTVPTGTQSNFAFTAIPQTYTDLFVVCTLRNTGSGFQDAGWVLNGSPSASGIYMGGTGAGQRAGVYPSQFSAVGDNLIAGYYSQNMAYIPSYTAGNIKCYHSSGSTGYASQPTYNNQNSGVYTSYSSAITSLTIMGDFVAGSSAALYGIKNS